MAEDHRRIDDEISDATVPVVVDVRAAHADGSDLDEHLVFTGGRYRPSWICRVPTPVITLARIVAGFAVVTSFPLGEVLDRLARPNSSSGPFNGRLPRRGVTRAHL